MEDNQKKKNKKKEEGNQNHNCIFPFLRSFCTVHCADFSFNFIYRYHCQFDL